MAISLTDSTQEEDIIYFYEIAGWRKVQNMKYEHSHQTPNKSETNPNFADSVCELKFNNLIGSRACHRYTNLDLIYFDSNESHDLKLFS